MKLILHIAGFLIFFSPLASSQAELYIGENGVASFKSDAPLEIIQAESKSLGGVIKPATKSFAFTISINSFQGFNSDIQRTHFLESYMEYKTYPHAKFIGKIIEDIPFDTPGTYSVRAKGELDIHGIKKERIIKGTLILREGSAHLQANFFVPLIDHGITIPKIVRQKISDQIAVSIELEFVQGAKS